MMYICSSQFATEEERLAFIKESLETAGADVEAEEQATFLHQGDVDPISDNEEGEQGFIIAPSHTGEI